MANVNQHPKTGIYRVRLTYPQRLRGILKASSVTKSLGTRNAALLTIGATYNLAIGDSSDDVDRPC